MEPESPQAPVEKGEALLFEKSDCAKKLFFMSRNMVGGHEYMRVEMAVPGRMSGEKPAGRLNEKINIKGGVREHVRGDR
ncbi:MAG: hypothetical protein AB1402_01745 [Bacillota bacterium]